MQGAMLPLMSTMNTMSATPLVLARACGGDAGAGSAIPAWTGASSSNGAGPATALFAASPTPGETGIVSSAAVDWSVGALGTATSADGSVVGSTPFMFGSGSGLTDAASDPRQPAPHHEGSVRPPASFRDLLAVYPRRRGAPLRSPLHAKWPTHLARSSGFYFADRPPRAITVKPAVVMRKHSRLYPFSLR